MTFNQNEFEAWTDKLNHMSTEDIANLMRQEGIKGKQLLPSSCAISAYLSNKVGAQVRVTNHYARKVLDDSGGPIWSTLWSTSVRTFIGNFDSGEYPDLVSDE